MIDLGEQITEFDGGYAFEGKAGPEDQGTFLIEGKVDPETAPVAGQRLPVGHLGIARSRNDIGLSDEAQVAHPEPDRRSLPDLLAHTNGKASVDLLGVDNIGVGIGDPLLHNFCEQGGRPLIH